MTDHIDRTVLPIRRPPFAGVTEQTLGGSQPDWGLIGHVKPPAGAPNVLLMLIDDAGFANPSTFGGPISTPNYDRMAAEGLRYNRFHVTAMCSPTRAALLTGRSGWGYPGVPVWLPGRKAAVNMPRVEVDVSLKSLLGDPQPCRGMSGTRVRGSGCRIEEAGLSWRGRCRFVDRDTCDFEEDVDTWLPAE